MEGGDLRMSSIDERVVQMKFENAAFERGVQQTLRSLEALNKGLQLQGATKGLAGVSTVAGQFSSKMEHSRNALGQFTTSVQQSSTVASSFTQKIEASHGVISKLSSGFSSLVGHVTSFGSKVSEGRNSLGQFTSGLSSTSGQADKAASSLQKIEGAVSTLAGKFSALGTMATGALMSIGAQAAQAGLRMANSFSFGPIMQGFQEYETNINSIQTILANTQQAGTTLDDVKHSLNELNHYADQTIYSFSEMTKNIGTFTSAGVDLKTSTAAIKGIANVAAMAGANSESASHVMYQLSQAISSGTVTMEDWTSVVNAGMASSGFQRALAMNAEKLGTLKDGAVKLKGAMKTVTVEGKSFTESIRMKPGQKPWLTDKVLLQTLKQFTGDMTDAQLKAEGFNKAEIKMIQAQAKVAKESATQVKTFTQLMDTTKEALGSGWATTWQLIFGDFTEAKGLFTGVSKSIGKLVGDSSDARNKMLSEWKKFGGRDALIDGLGNSFKALGSVIKPIKDAFRQIFPATTGKQLADMTKSFRDFTEKLKIGSDTADKLKRTFAGVFAIFGIAVDVVKAVVHTIFDLVGVATKGSGGFLNFTAKIGDFLVALRNGIKEGKGLTNFFKGLGTVLAIPIKLIQKLAGFLGSLFKDTDSKDVEKSVEGVSRKLEPLGRLGDVVSKAWDKTLTVMKNVGNFFSKLGDNISRVMQSIGIDLGSMFEGFDMKTLFAGLDTGLLAGLFLIVKKFLGSFGDGAGGIFDAISEGIGNLTGTFSTMQNTLKAATLLQIALAIGVLSVSLSILAKINPDDLTKAGAAITVLFGQLLGALTIFTKFIGTAGFAKMPFVMGSLILLAGAILILVQAVKQLSGLNWNELAKGLTGLAVVLGLVVGALKLMPNPSGMISTGLGMIALAAGIKILASAVADLSGLSWQDLAKGLVGVGAILGSLVLFTKFAKADGGGISQGLGIILLAAGIKILASAVADMSKLSWTEIARGLVTLAGALGIITGALMLIPPTAPLAAAGVLGVAISLGMVAKALAEMAQMSWGEIGSSLTVMLGALSIIAAALYVIPPTAPLAAAGVLIVALALQQIAGVLSGFAAYSWEEIGLAMTMLAGTMGIIAGAMLLMTGALPGAAATLVIAAALAVLAPVLQQFAAMSLAEIGTSLLMLAGVFAVFGAAALLLAPVVPLMIALGIAVGVLGVGMLAAGAGVFLFATGLTALAAAGAAGAAAIIGIVGGLIGLIPKFMEGIGKGVVAFAKVIATAGPAIFQAMTAVMTAMLNAINKLAPKIVSTLLRMLTMLLQQLANYVPKMVVAGMKLITGVLNGIAQNIGKMIDAATKVIVAFLGGISKNLPKIIDAGVKLIISFVNGVSKAIDSHAKEMGAAGVRLALAIVKGMVKGIMGGIGVIKDAAKKVASAALDGAKDFLGIHSPSKEFEKVGNYVNDGFKKGLDGNKAQIDQSFKDMSDKLKALSKSAKATGKERKKAAEAYKLLNTAYKDEHKKLDSLADKYDKYTDKIKAAEQALTDIKKTRDDFKKQITDQYSVLPDITAETTVASYESDLKTQIEKTKQFANTLQRLRDLGLNDDAYKQLLAKGIDALPFANQILAGGKNAVNEVNSLDKQLQDASKALGKSASSELYDAAVHSAEGLVKGLKIQQKAIEKQMDVIASAMVNAIKKKLGIKSPSRVFMEIGDYSARGLIRGLDEMSGSVGKAAASTGTVAVESLKKSMSGFSDLIVGGVELQPTITPVLDLSSVKRTASQIGSVLPSQSMSVDASYAKAKSISSEKATTMESSTAQTAAISKSVNFTQNNYSPKALSTAEIYRQTNNQISKAKEALT
jgi:tape measure domain-containing protein